jgi:hypothetical protein
MSARVESARLVINTTAAKRVDHEEIAVHFAAPEGSAEKGGDAQVMPRSIVVLAVRTERALQISIVALQTAELVIRHRQHHCIERVPPSSGVHEVALARAGDRADAVAQQNFRSEVRRQLCNQLLEPAHDGIQRHISAIVHEDILNSVQGIGGDRLGRDIGSYCSEKITARGLVGDLSKKLFECHRRERAGVVVAPRTLIIIILRTENLGAPAVEGTDGREGSRAVEATDIVGASKDPIAQDDCASLEWHRLKSQLLH